MERLNIMRIKRYHVHHNGILILQTISKLSNNQMYKKILKKIEHMKWN